MWTPKNLMELGNVLRPVTETLAKVGTTLVLAHHANRQMPVGQPMELANLAFSGLEQFTRQFILINRRSHYRSDGRHELVMRVGGSAGHGGLFHLDVDEGVMDAGFGGRHWTPTVRLPESRHGLGEGQAGGRGAAGRWGADRGQGAGTPEGAAMSSEATEGGAVAVLPGVLAEEVIARLDRIERALVARDHFSTHQAAARLNLSEWTARQAFNTDRIKGEKPNGRSWRIPLAEVERVERQGGLGPASCE